jgi:hypothetical protein
VSTNAVVPAGVRTTESSTFGEPDLDEVRDLQAALHMVLESPLDPEEKAVAARRLLASARSRGLPEFAIRAMQWVLERDIDRLTSLHGPDEFGSVVERRLLQMHRRGESSCGECLRPLPSVATIELLQRERALAAMHRDWIHARVERSTL